MLKDNPFLIELLALQQDGEQAISAPTNWSTPPLLEVETPLDDAIDALVDDCICRTDSTSGRWHFLVGSPGNGKSAAVGKLVRELQVKHQCRIIDEATRKTLTDLPATPVPYALDVYEPGKNFKFLQIVQDASVVRKPFSEDSDPSKDLLETLQLAWNRGTSLVVCTNRGVLEKAYRDTHLNPQYSREVWHKDILKPLVEHPGNTSFSSNPIPTPKEKNVVFQTIVASADFLDTRSLLLKPSNIFERLIEQATDAPRWAACTDCSSRYLCPLKGNRDWMINPEGKQAVVLTFRRAETMSSQVIVLREALAALSFLLAGCARDYTTDSPCQWVHKLVAEEDYFALASRRVYMSLYASTSPRGLDCSTEVYRRQHKALQDLQTLLRTENRECKALSATLTKPHPSTDVGVKRLFEADGVFSRLNITNGPYSPEFSDRWDSSYTQERKSNSALVTELEIKCTEVWNSLEDAAEALNPHLAPEVYWSLRRWSSQFTLHCGALAETKLFTKTDTVEHNPLAHIDQFCRLIELLAEPDSHGHEKHSLRLELKKMIREALNQTDDTIGGESAIRLMHNITVNGRWFQRHIDINPEQSPASGSLTVAVYFNEKEYTTLTAPMYLWLKQRLLGTMVKECIPTAMLRETIDAKSRAVAKSEYANAEDDVVMRIAGEKEIFILSRDRGGVDLDVHSKP